MSSASLGSVETNVRWSREIDDEGHIYIPWILIVSLDKNYTLMKYDMSETTDSDKIFLLDLWLLIVYLTSSSYTIKQ